MEAHDFSRVSVHALISNGDRHTNNIAFVVKDGIIQPAPFFDNGDAFFSDLYWFPKSNKLEKLFQRRESKPFSNNFNIQKNILEEKNGVKFQTSFSKADLQSALFTASSFYKDDILRRVEAIILYSMELYQDLFISTKEDIVRKEALRYETSLDER